MSNFDIFVATDNHGKQRIIIKKSRRGNVRVLRRFNGYDTLKSEVNKSGYRRDYVRDKDGPWGTNLHRRGKAFKTIHDRKYHGGTDEDLIIRHPCSTIARTFPLGRFKFSYCRLENRHANSQFSGIFRGEVSNSKNQFDVFATHNIKWTDIFIRSPFSPLQSVNNHITGLVKIGSFTLSDEKEFRGTKSKSLAENFISMLGAAQGNEMKAALGKINSTRKRVIENTIIGALHTSRAKRIFMEKNYPLGLYKHLFESFKFKFNASKHHNLDTDMHLIQYIGSADDVVRTPGYYIRAYERLKTDRFFPPRRNRRLDDLFGRTFTRLHSCILQYIYTNISVIQDVVWENVSRSDFIETDLYKDLAKLFDEESHYAAKRSLADIVSWTQQNRRSQCNVMQEGAGADATSAASPHLRGAPSISNAAEQDGTAAGASGVVFLPPSAPPMPQDDTQQQGALVGGDAHFHDSNPGFFQRGSTVGQRKVDPENTPQCGSGPTSCCVS